MPPTPGPDAPRLQGSLLVAVDLSDNARKVVAAAQGLAKDLGCGVTLVHAFDRLPPLERTSGAAAMSPRALEAIAQQEADDVLRLTNEMAEPLRQDGIPVEVVARQGVAWETILEEAARNGCPLVVVGTAGRSKVQEMWLGSTAQVVLRRSEVPVLVVPDRMGKAAWPAADPHRVLLVATDFSPDAEAALSAAVRLAKDLRAHVRLLHALPGVPTSFAGPLDQGQAPDPQGLEAEAAARLGLQASAAHAKQVGVTPAVRHAAPVPAILAEAQDCGAALVVVGTHGRSGLRRFLLGSVAEGLVRMADRPVLVVPRALGGPRGDWLR